ncbi:hypothetical protein FRB98_002090 [Tulasnella sp. 332]|nr:hypothetical protein FRB98_002090 [Tulasnella sp. 332]
MSKLIRSPSISNPLSVPKGRIRKWSFSRSKDKKAQDNHFVRTNSGRWIKTEHPLIMTDDEDDEARRRREQQEASEQEEALRQASFDGHQSGHGHNERKSSDHDFQDGPVLPPWHAGKPSMQWDPYSQFNIAGPSTSPIRNHSHTQSQPVNSYSQSAPSAAAEPAPSSTYTTPSAISPTQATNIHTPPVPVAFPSMNYIAQPSPRIDPQDSDMEDSIEPRREKDSRRMKYKPGSLYPLHNPIKPDQPYTNWHLRPPDYDLPPIFMQPGYGVSGAGGIGAASGSSGGGAGRTAEHQQTSSGNGSPSGMVHGSSPATEGVDARLHPLTTQPPQHQTLQQSTSAILGHSASHASLSRLANGEPLASPSSPFPNLAANAHALLSPRSQSETALQMPQSLSEVLSPRGHSPMEIHPKPKPEPGTLDVSDPLWGTTWSHASPYDLGRTPLNGIRIPAPMSGGINSAPNAPLSPANAHNTLLSHRRRAPSPSPLGGIRLRRPSADPAPGERSRKQSQERDRSVSRPPSPGVEPKEEQHTPEPMQIPTQKSKVSGGGLRGLFQAAGSAINLSPEDGIMPRVRKRTISLGQTGIGIALGLGGSSNSVSANGGVVQTRGTSFEIVRKLSFTGGGGHTRKPSFEVVRKPSVKPQQRPEIAPVSTNLEQPGDVSHDDDTERGRPAQPKVLPDTEYATSPVDATRVSDDGMLRPSMEMSSRRGSEDLGRRTSNSSSQLTRTPSGSRPVISHPLPLKRSPSTSSTAPSMALVLNSKKSVSHLGHGEINGVGLGRSSSQNSQHQSNGGGPPTVQQPRGRKTSKPVAPPRTLNKYVHRFSANELPRSSQEPFMERRGGDGAPGMFNKLAKKLSWITKTASGREREREVEEKMKMYEKERDLERKLEQARDRVDSTPREYERPAMHHDREAEVTGGDDDQPQTPDAHEQEASEVVSESFEQDGEASQASHLSAPHYYTAVQHGISDGEQSGAEASTRVETPSQNGSSDFFDPRSPAKGRRTTLQKTSASNLHHLTASPAMTVDQALTPLTKLANVLMSPKAPAAAVPTPAQVPASSLLSPMSLAATSLFSPKKTPSDSHLTLNMNVSSPLLSDSRNPSPTRPGTDGSSPTRGQTHQHSRGPSPVPPRPVTSPERRDSLASLPRMALTIMNPDTPSPPTSTRELFPVHHQESEKRRRHSHARQLSTHLKEDTAREEAVRPERQERMSLRGNSVLDEAPAVPPKPQKPPVQKPKHVRDQDSSGSSGTTSPRPSDVPPSAATSSSAGSGAPYDPRQAVASVYSRPDSSTLTLTMPNQGHLSDSQRLDATKVGSPGIGYAVAPTGTQSLDSMAYYSPHHQAVLVPAQLSNGVSVMMIHPNYPQVIPAMQQLASQGPPIHPLYASPYRSNMPEGSSGSFTSPTESITTTMVQASSNYQSSQPSRPNLPQHSASDPQKAAKTDGEVHRQLGRPQNPTRRETIAVTERQWEVPGDENDKALDSKQRRSDSKASTKPRRKTSSRQQSGGSYETFGGTVIEEIRGMEPHEISRERDRQIRNERESDRERARVYWERERAREQERAAAKAKQRQRSPDLTDDLEQDRMAEIERQVRDSAWIPPSTNEDQERRDRERRVSRRSSKLTRASTASTIPPPPPPKNDVPSSKPSTHSSSSSVVQDVPARHSRSRRDQNDPSSPPARPGKLSKSDKSRPSAPIANMNIGAIPKHHLDQKSLPRPMSEVRVEQDLSTIKANEAFARDRILKGTSLALDRSTMVEHVLGRNGPIASPERESQPLLPSPQSRGLPRSPGHGSVYTSFSLQSPYMNSAPPLHRPQFTYIPAPLGQHRDNPLPRPPRDTSLDIASR